VDALRRSLYDAHAVVPGHLHWLFWDVAVEQFEPAAYARYTIRRVLEYGDEDAVAWLRDLFDLQQILDVLRTDRTLTPLSASFWALVFGVPADEVVALRTARSRAATGFAR